MWESNGRHSNLAEQSVVPKGKVTREREEREKQRKERRQQLSQQQEGSEEKDELVDVLLMPSPTASLLSPPSQPSSSSSPSIFTFLSSSSSSASSSSTVTTGRGNKRVYGQQPFRPYTANNKQLIEEAEDAQVQFFLHANVPHLVADKPYLLNFIVKAVRAGWTTILPRRAMAKRVKREVEKVMARVTDTLRQSAGVSVGVDGWTNIRHEKVVNLCPVSGGKAFYWDSKVLKQGASALEQAPLVLDGLLSLIDAGVRVTAIVTDNESVNGALHRELKKSLPFLLHIPCAAHTIQLCVRATLMLKPVQPLIQAFTLLLTTFKANKKLRNLVKQQQLLLPDDYATPLQIVYPCDTRWNSMLYAAQRLLRLAPAIHPHINSIRAAINEGDATPLFDDATFWTPLRTIIHFLTVYQKATDVVQSDSATLKDVHHQFIQIVESADALVTPHPFAPMREKVVNLVRNQWVQHAAIDAIHTVLFFSLDDLYQQATADVKASAMKWFLQWGVQFLVYYKRHRYASAPAATHVASVEAELTGQYADFKSGQSKFADFRHRLGLLKGNAKKAWELYSDYEIGTCVLALFNVTANEAAVERSFSRQGLIHSKLRNRLADQSVKQHMRYSFNTRALDQPFKPDRGLWKELPDNDEAPAEEGNGMELLGFGLEEYDEVAAAESEVDNVDEYSDSDERVEDDQQRSELALKEVMDEKDEPAALVEEQRAEEQVIGPVVSRKRKARQERSDAAPDEREERMRMSKQRRSAQSTPKSLEEVISEWIEEHGDAWSPQLRTVLEGSLLTHGVPITIAVAEGMLKQRLSEVHGHSGVG